MSSTVSADLDRLLDQERIFEAVRRERFARDQGEWDLLGSMYLPDSTVRTTWFTGTGPEFAMKSKEMADNGRHSKHPIWPIYAKIKGDRAITESYSQIQNRSRIDGVEVDMLQHCRFFSRLVRTMEGWKFASFESIYQKDSISPVNPHDTVPIRWEDLQELRPSYRIWAWAMHKRGYNVPDDLLGDDRPDLVHAYYRESESWLNEG